MQIGHRRTLLTSTGVQGGRPTSSPRSAAHRAAMWSANSRVGGTITQRSRNFFDRLNALLGSSSGTSGGTLSFFNRPICGDGTRRCVGGGDR